MTTELAPPLRSDPPPVNLYKALHNARKQMGLVAHSGENKFDHYSYAKLSDYLNEIQPALNANDLILLSEPGEPSWGTRTTKAGGTEIVCRVPVSMQLIHAPTGDMIVATVLGEGQDRGDKAYYKALTGARKYLIASIFNLATAEDPEVDSHDEPETGSKGSKGTTKKSTKPPAAKETFTKPEAWPDSTVEQIQSWIDTLESAAAFKVALGVLQGEVGLTTVLTEWEPVLKHFAAAYKEKRKKVATDELNAAIKAALDKLALDLQGSEAFQPQPTE